MVSRCRPTAGCRVQGAGQRAKGKGLSAASPQLAIACCPSPHCPHASFQFTVLHLRESTLRPFPFSGHPLNGHGDLPSLIWCMCPAHLHFALFTVWMTPSTSITSRIHDFLHWSLPVLPGIAPSMALCATHSLCCTFYVVKYYL